MKNNSSYLLSMVAALFVGAFCMYVYIQKNPIVQEQVSTGDSIVKNVNVTENGISSGIENVYDSVVVVENYQKTKLAGIGSGFVYDAKGYILTNHHVIEDASEVKVKLMDGETIVATVIGSDEYADIAVIKIDASHVKRVAKIGDNSKMKVGDTVFTIGSPLSVDYAGTVTRGILSGKDRMVAVSISNSSTNDWIMNVMQTDAAINPGNSGGPLCNVSGEVIGVNSMKVVKSEIEGIGFAIPIEDAIEYANLILKGEKIQRAYLGVSMTDFTTSSQYLRQEGITIDGSVTSGVIVVEAVKGGPCADSGIKKGDVITKLGKYDITSVAELRYYLYKYKPKEKIEIKVMRGETEKTFNVTLGAN